ncbi:dynein heavy chain 1, axonemal-like [Trachemys scripta elegans]|uniref:dynein heavy chain 1, axonemal-like n=1 Tax=Trachemys scripta elegans TaxID=31138 RepID=UPI0015579D6E|nr:dynein heavy chain 1, axonemal-like [Trachemys scripta elegans]
MDKTKKELTDSLGRSPYSPHSNSQAQVLDPSPGASSSPMESIYRGTNRKYPMIKQKGFYSDVLYPGATAFLGDVCAGPSVYKDLLRQADREQHTPKGPLCLNLEHNLHSIGTEVTNSSGMCPLLLRGVPELAKQEMYTLSPSSLPTPFCMFWIFAVTHSAVELCVLEKGICHSFPTCKWCTCPGGWSMTIETGYERKGSFPSPEPGRPTGCSLVIWIVGWGEIETIYHLTGSIWAPRSNVLNCLQCLEKEVSLDYERTMNKIIFDGVITSKPQTFSYVTLPEKEEEKVPERGLVKIPDYPFDEQRASFIFVSLLTRPEVILALSQVRDECNKAAAMSLFHSTLSKYGRLEEFEQIQTQTFTQVQMFLKDTWINTLKIAVKSSLREIGKGWYNLYQSNWGVYQMSKLHKLMELIKFNLQDSVRFLVQDSLVSFTQLLLDACGNVLNCSEDMEWGGDLINSPYKPRKNPLFVVDLILDNSGVHFSTPLENFETSLISLFDKGILATHTIPQLETYVLENMFIRGTPLLESVGLHEPPVEELRNTIRSAICKAVIPLQAYAKQYENQLELNNNDINSFLKEYQAQCPSAQDVRNIVNLHLSEKEMLDNTLPSSIIIGPFYVSIEGVKQNLSKKRKALATSMLDLLAKNLHLQVENICEVFKAISRKMYEKPNSIEELAELREWMKGVPEQLKAQEELIIKVMEDYEVMEEFLYNLTQDDFNDKWAASNWPLKIATQTEMIRQQHLEDEERFRKIQLMDQNNFLERLDGLQVLII